MKGLINRIYSSPSFGELFRFCIVGTIATGIDATVFYLVRQVAVYQVALISGYFISLVANYFLTVLWTFKQKPSVNNAIAVMLAHLFNLFVVRMGMMFILVEELSVNDSYAYIPTVILSVMTNFIIIKFLIKRL